MVIFDGNRLQKKDEKVERLYNFVIAKSYARQQQTSTMNNKIVDCHHHWLCAPHVERWRIPLRTDVLCLYVYFQFARSETERVLKGAAGEASRWFGVQKYAEYVASTCHLRFVSFRAYIRIVFAGVSRQRNRKSKRLSHSLVTTIKGSILQCHASTAGARR